GFDRVVDTGGAHQIGLLRDNEVHNGCAQVRNGLLGSVEVGHLDHAGQIGVFNRLRGALCTEEVGAKDSVQVRHTLQHRTRLLGGNRGTVVVVVDSDQLDRAIGGVDRVLTTLFAFDHRAAISVHVLDVQLAGSAHTVDQGLTADTTAIDIVRTDVRKREG